MGVCGWGYKRDGVNNHPFVLWLTGRPVLFALFLPDSAVSGETESVAIEHAVANSNRAGWGAERASKCHTHRAARFSLQLNGWTWASAR